MAALHLRAKPNETLEEVVSRCETLIEQDALTISIELARQIQALHSDSGQLHLAVQPARIKFDDRGRVRLGDPIPSRGFGGPHSDAEFCPPELQSQPSVVLLSDLKAAQAAIAGAGVDCDPTRVDRYQLGALLCRLVTGETVSAYLSSPRVAGKLSEDLRRLIDKLLGYAKRESFADLHDFILDGERLLKDLRPKTDLTEADQETVDAVRAEGHSKTQASDTDTSPISVAEGPQSDTAVDPPRDETGSSNSDLPFQNLGHYRIVARIGHGGMADVYRAYDGSLRRPVALKVLPQGLAREEEYVRRFKAEATAVASVTHPNVLQVFFIGEDGGHHFFAMEYVEGESLAELLKRQKALSVERTFAIAEQILSGLAAAHNQGIIHRDIKPGNILMDQKRDRAVLADFGLVKSIYGSRTMTASGVVMGTVDYISPEQGRGHKVDKRTDLYSFGVVMYQMLSGRLPFEADNPTSMIFQHVYEPPLQLEDVARHVSGPLASLVHRMLAKSPDERHGSAEDVLTNLRALCAALPARRGSDEGTGSGVTNVTASAPPSRVIQSPQFPDSMPSAPNLPEAAKTGWWVMMRDRLLGGVQAYAPEVAQRIQNTQQLVDGAVAEYESRRDRLQRLIREAESVCTELARQAQANRDALGVRSEPEGSDVDAMVGRETSLTEFERRQTADELDEQVAQQREQLDSMRLNLAQVNANLGKLRTQRDALRARLKVAQARQKIESGSPRRSAPRNRMAFVVGLLAAVFVLVLVGRFAYFLVASFRHPHSPQFVLESRGSGGKLNGSPGTIDRTPVEQRPPIREFAGHDKSVFSVAFNGDGTTIATASFSDRSVRLWEAATGRQLSVLDTEQQVFALAFSPDGKQLATGDVERIDARHVVTIWDVATEQPVRRLQGDAMKINQLAFRSDGSMLAGVGSRNDTPQYSIRLWDLKTGTRFRTIPLVGSESTVALSPGPSVLAIVGSRLKMTRWEASVDQPWLDLKEGGLVQRSAFSPDGSTFATLEMDGRIAIWDAASSKLTTRVTLVPDEIPTFVDIRALALSWEGRKLAVATRYATRICDVETGQTRLVLEGQQFHCVAFSPDGRRLVSGGSRPPVLLWDTSFPSEVEPDPVPEMVGQ